MFDFDAELLRTDPDFGCPIAAAVVDLSADSHDVRTLTASAFDRWERQLAGAIAARSKAEGEDAHGLGGQGAERHEGRTN